MFLIWGRFERRRSFSFNSLCGLSLFNSSGGNTQGGQPGATWGGWGMEYFVLRQIHTAFTMIVRRGEKVYLTSAELSCS